MLYIIIALVLVLLTVGASARLRALRAAGAGGEEARAARYATWALVVLTIVVTLGFSVDVVPTNSMSVVTTFGKPSGTVNGNGLNVTLPWQSTTRFDSARQLIRFSADPKAENAAPRIGVRLARQATADLTGVLDYSIPPDGVVNLFRTWKNEERIRKHLVLPELGQSASATLATYDPLTAVTQDADALTRLSRAIQEELTVRLAGRVVVHRVLLENVDYDDATEARIRDLQAAYAADRLAAQRIEIARKEAEANRIIAESLKAAGGADVAVVRCLEMVERVTMAKGPGALPIGFSCFGTSLPIGAVVPR